MKVSDAIAIGIIGVILIAILVPSFHPRQECVIGGPRTEHDFRLLEQAIYSFRLDMGVFPDNLDDLFENKGNSNNWTGPYMLKRSNLVDPWGFPYEYELLSNKEFKLCSLGADGKLGGTDKNADTCSSNSEK